MKEYLEGAGAVVRGGTEGSERAFLPQEGLEGADAANPESAFLKGGGGEGADPPENAFRMATAQAEGNERIETINSEYEGRKHPDTEVPYEKDKVNLPEGRTVEGVFPVFDPEYTAQLPEDKLTDTDYWHKKECNKQLGEAIDKDPELRAKFSEEQIDQIKKGYNPDGYVWHHHQQPGRMELVDTEKHVLARHTGGRALWGGGNEMRHGSGTGGPET